MSNDRLTPKEIKAWCDQFMARHGVFVNDKNLELLYRIYKRGYQDALGG